MIETDCMKVKFDGRNRLIIFIGRDSGVDVTGMCGNCDDDNTNDYILRNGTDVSHLPNKFELIGDSWWLKEYGELETE